MIDDLFAKLAPVLGQEKTNRLWLIYQTETDLEKRREIEGIVHTLAQKYLSENYQRKRILLPPPEMSNEDGILLGTIHYGEQPRYEHRMPMAQLLTHAGIYGATGAGKSNLGFLITKQLLEREIPFMIFDWKRNYRDILSAGWSIKKKPLVYTVARDICPFAFNPLQPPLGMDQETWDNKVIDILCHSHFLGHGVSYLLKTLLRKTEHQTMLNLFATIMKTKTIGRQRQWLDSSTRAVGDLCTGKIGEIFNGDTSIETLLSRSVVFELDALHEDAKTFFIEVILAWIHQFRLNQSERETLKHVVIIEEAHHILTKRREFQEKETIMDVVLREIRELGEAIVVLDQHPSLISKPALGNAGTTVIMRLKHADDVRAASDTLLLGPSQREYIGQLETGWAIVKSSAAPKPFLIRIPFVEVKKGVVSDERLKREMTGYSDMNGVIPPLREPKPVIPPIPEKDKEDRGGYSEKLPDEETRFLQDVGEFPFSGVVERYRRLKLGTQRGTDLKSLLETKGLLEQNKVSTGDAAIACLELTTAGREVLNKDRGVSVDRSSKRIGGPEHRFWVNRMSEELRQNGFQVEEESPIGSGKSVDVVAEGNGKRIAVEIETGKSDAVKNIEKNLASGFDKVVVVSTSKLAREKLLNQLREKDLV